MAKNTLKTDSVIGAERVKQNLLARFNPIRGLTPQRLATYLDQFAVGYLREAALLWDKIADRDDQVVTVVEKRKMEVALLNWEVLPSDDSPEASAHKQALEDFYNNITVTHALDEDQRGGVALLARQMMDAIGNKYAAHEIVWEPQPDFLTATVRFVPLWFFEKLTGRLRFLPTEGAVFGNDLEAGGWIVTVGRGLMESTSIAYLFKQLPLKDWLLYCEKFGMPGLHGQTDAAKGSDDWNSFRDALANFGIDWALLTNLNGKIETITAGAQGNMPHPELVDRMDRAIARVWRGGDLSTMSRSHSAVGSNPQQEENDKLTLADAGLISETLQNYVDRWVIKYRFGIDQPKAYFRIVPAEQVDYAREIQVDQFLISAGAPVAVNDLLERYGRPQPDAGEVLATKPVPAGPAVGGPTGVPTPPAPAALPNIAPANLQQFIAAARAKLGAAHREQLQSLIKRLEHIAEMPDLDQRKHALERFRAALPQIAAETLKTPALQSVANQWADAIGTALVSGFAEHAVKTGKVSAKS